MQSAYAFRHKISTNVGFEFLNEDGNAYYESMNRNFGNILTILCQKRGSPCTETSHRHEFKYILHRFWQTGTYEKHPVHGPAAEEGLVEDGGKAHAEGVKETMSPAMDILVSLNFERLL